MQSNRTSLFKIVTVVRLLAVVALLLAGALSYAQPAAASPDAQADFPIVHIYSISDSSTWATDTIYYVHSDLTVSTGQTLTIQGGAIVKFDVPGLINDDTRINLSVLGNLVIQNATQANPVYFTSSRDDTIGGPVNGDPNTPNFGDWGSVILYNRTAEVSNLHVRYGMGGIKIQNEGSTLLSPVVQNNIFKYNGCGVTLAVNSIGGFDSLVAYNSFEENEYGFCTDQVNPGDTGAMNPTIRNNTFSKNRKLPLLLEGSAFPVYGSGAETNTFLGYLPNGNGTYEHLGIGLRGVIYQNATWPFVPGYNGVNMPYVVVGALEIKAGSTVTTQVGMLFKFYTRRELETTVPAQPLPSILVNGSLVMPTSPAGYNPAIDPPLLIFTSYHDDTTGEGAIGDTNGDGYGVAASTEPLAGDWGSVQIRDTRVADAAEMTFEHMHFRYGTNGLHYQAALNEQERQPLFNNLNFKGNINGLRIESTNSINGRVTPTIQFCTFEANGRLPEDIDDDEHGVPIFLVNTVIPTYNDNTFTNNMHMAIGVTGTWYTSTTWGPVDVLGQGLVQYPYLVHGTVNIGRNATQGRDDSVTLTIPAGAFIKFSYNPFDVNNRASLISYGALILQSDIGTEPITFTSIYDDDGGETSGDPRQPSRLDWLKVEARHPGSRFINLVVRGGQYGLYIHSAGAYDISSAVQNSLFENNTRGLYLHVARSGDITGPITDCIFRNNDYGLETFATYDVINTTGISQPVLTRNTFQNHSEFPIYLHGSASLTYTNLPNGSPSNTFSNNLHKAIGLGGHFGSNDTDTYSLPRVYGDPTLPGGLTYVVIEDTTFQWDSHTDMDGGLVFKFKSGKLLKFLGALNMETDSTHRNYFTSYVDDYYDNTDAAAQPPTLTRNYWKGVYIAHPLTADFSYSTVTHADLGLVLLQDEHSLGTIDPEVIDNTYTENIHGLTFWIDSDNDILPAVTGCRFTNNDYGLYVNTVHDSVDPNIGTANPVLRRNAFNGHKEFPIYLNGSSNPTYITTPVTDKNTFTASTRPAIAVGGHWYREATWTRVEGDLDTPTQDWYFPYVVKENLFVRLYNYAPPQHATITLPARSLVKVMNGRYVYVYGRLVLESAPGNEIVFTSYHDDTLYPEGISNPDTGGNTDGTTTTPVEGGWESVWLFEFPTKCHDVHDVITRYAEGGWIVEYNGDDGDVTTSFERARFEKSVVGITLFLGWEKIGQEFFGARGNIVTPLTDITFFDNSYGLITTVYSDVTGVRKGEGATGIISPMLNNVTFSDIRGYPMFLGGTTQPSFLSGNRILASEQFAALQVSGEGAAALPAVTLDLPEPLLLPEASEPSIAPAAIEIPEKPGASLDLAAIPDDLAPAIALAGAWNAPVALPEFTNFPFAVPGNFPITFTLNNDPFKADSSVTIGQDKPSDVLFATLTVPPGAGFKFAKDLNLTVRGLGDLVLEGVSESNPTIFTSLYDDGVGGDTNRDGAITRPLKENYWKGIIYSSENPEARFEYSVVRYATEGLHFLASSDYYLSIKVQASHNLFVENTTGMTLEALRSADLDLTVENNRFLSNDTHILGKPNVGYAGRLLVKAHINDLVGGSDQVGIINQNMNPVECNQQTGPCGFDATNNYWGHSSGPMHAALNPDGQGCTVSTNVLFNPFSTSYHNLPEPLIIKGRVTWKDENGVAHPLSGVLLSLVPTGGSVYSDVSGNYEFTNLEPGTYTILPHLVGYSFAPSQMFLHLTSPATNLDFYATPNGEGRKVSVNSMTVFKSTTADTTIRVTLTLDEPNVNGTAISVLYNILNGTAVGGKTGATGVDYTSAALSGTIQFGRNVQTRTIDIVIKRTDPDQPDKFFTVQLSNPVNVQISQGTAIIYILTPCQTYLPMLRK